MIYTLTVKGLARKLVWVFSTIPFIIFVGFFAIKTALLVTVIVFFILMLAPQLFLIIQYHKTINYDSIEIDYKNEEFKISRKNKISIRKFSELHTIVYNKAVVPISYGSLVLLLCSSFYYYKIRFENGDIYYLTCMMSPAPRLSAKHEFYDYFIEKEILFAFIR